MLSKHLDVHTYPRLDVPNSITHLKIRTPIFEW
jgi:hypothetical protein